MKIISGGQTGADRAALDVALALGWPHGGSVPRGRAAEDGMISPRYRVNETTSSDPAERTKLNVLNSDGTLLITHGEPKGGSALTRSLAEENRKPLLHIDLNAGDGEGAARRVAAWLRAASCETLNVAGAREDEDPGIYKAVFSLLMQAFSISAGGTGREREARGDEIVSMVYDQFFDNFRHWDQIRWNVSMGLLALFAAVFAGVTAMQDRVGEPLLAYSIAAMALVATLWTLLLYRLVRYHNYSLRRLEVVLRERLSSGDTKTLLHGGILPFSFEFPRMLSTASFWFMLVFFFIAVGGWLYSYSTLATLLPELGS